MVKIGEKIKFLRIKRSLTQEKLSEVLGVSSQAISRWENCTTYPDINMLPSIATYFQVSVDELLGMDEIRNDKEIIETHQMVHKLIKEDMIKEAISELRRALKHYPSDYGFMCELALALSLYQDYDVTLGNIEEAIDLSENILNNCVNDKIRSTTKASLCYLYLKSDNDNKARELASTLPHIWESRELLLPEINSDGMSDIDLKHGIKTCIDTIYIKIQVRKLDKKSNTSKMLMLGANRNESITDEEKLSMILEYIG